jgi:hypothetical protein
VSNHAQQIHRRAGATGLPAKGPASARFAEWKVPVWPTQSDLSDFDSHSAETLCDQDEMAAQKTNGTNDAAANSLVSRLVKLNVISEMTGYARNRRFRYAPYIALFNDTGPGEDSPQAGT